MTQTTQAFDRDRALPVIRADADQVRVECEKVRVAHDGVLRAKDLVDAAREESSPLHPLFTWDDEIAGEKWREIQARQVIRVFIVRSDALLPDEDEGQIEGKVKRVYLSTPDQRSTGGGYLHREQIENDSDRRRQMARLLVSDVRRIANSPQYAGFDELQGFLKEIDTIASKWWWKLDLA